MKIIIGADLVPTKSNHDLFVKGDVEGLLGTELKEIIDQADYRIFNLEVPIVNYENPIVKKGPNLIAQTDTINGIKSIGTDLLTLANNHILDQGVDGLNSTISVLEQHQIAYVGAGNDLNSAHRAHVFHFSDKTIGVYACAEHEFSIANETHAGANPFNPLESLDHIHELKEKCDFVIVLYHGGKEYYRYPSPLLRKVCQKLIDKGADLVVCQHSHCIGCKENYHEGVIIYGQGNFLFDGSEHECWQTSLLIQVNDHFEISYIPIIKQKNVVRLATTQQANDILKGFEERSKEIMEPDAIERRYDEFAKKYVENYLDTFGGNKGILLNFLSKVTKGRIRALYLEKRFKIKQLVSIRNYVECEAHRELVLRGINNRMEEQ